MELGGFVLATFLSPPVLAIIGAIIAVIIGLITVWRQERQRKQKRDLLSSRRAGLEQAWKK